ncbi:hypothetical protein [Pleionea litopenaei]|uniref:Uncharacterized protein n=1 Tax=Pleionea litopenaei TaxID=3070815 RepID=A0AA51RQX6_9GAMM|nr:hypothetical protein [Pleionea sp. HL-JVS1]WMS85971.1 hypothetical protein Q9312_12160 [Pleionea sp. HL-JVS1]
MLEVILAVALAAIMMAVYQGLRGGFEYLNQARLEAKANVVTAPRWLQALMLLAFATLIGELVFIWMSQVWLVALAITVGTFMVSVSLKMLFMPRSESDFYQRVFGEAN